MKTCMDCSKPLKGHDRKYVRCPSCAARARYIAKYGKPAIIRIFICAACNREFSDYESNRKDSKNVFCSDKCRALWVGISNSIENGGDGLKRTKQEKDAIYYRKTADVIRKRVKEYYSQNRKKVLEGRRIADRSLKQQVVDAYGKQCECCGETKIEFLTIDHIKGDGGLHRRRVGKGRRIYKDLILLGFPKDNYRLLCFNCNISRGFNGYCPHKPEERQQFDKRPKTNVGRPKIVA